LAGSSVAGQARRTADVAGGTVIDVEGLRVSFPGRRGTTDVVRDVGFSLRAGECLAIVGESGSGKSVTARALVGLAGRGAAVSARRLRLGDTDLTGLSDREWRRVRGGRIGLVLQDALQSLDPLRQVGAEIAETLVNHRTVPRPAIPARVIQLLEQSRVPEPEVRARQYPHELSGGLRQRALIAAAMAADPEVLIADEPTTALDVSVQAQILNLLAERKAAGTAILLISHDLSVVARLADRVAVMFGGRLVEEGPAAELLAEPWHPYTRELLAAVPALHAKGLRLSAARGAGVAGPGPGGGCVFAARCPLAVAACHAAEPEPTEVGPGHSVRCPRTAEPWPAPPARDARSQPSWIAERAGPVPAETGDVVLAVDGLVKSFRSPDRTTRRVVDDVSFELTAGGTLGLVGESGAGKTTVAQLVLGLLEPDAGSVRLLGQDWSPGREAARRPARRQIQLVPQDPMAAFDPRYPVAAIIGEALGTAGSRTPRRREAEIAELLELVGLDASFAARRPRELSGGQRQRVAIARALAPRPAVLVSDEPVSALDVSVQAQILDLFADVQDWSGVAMLFISHDLGVIYHVSDRILVMRDARVIESGSVEEVFARPREPYTRELIEALPQSRLPPRAP
jgi:peptide/nickel transport system ATP-binding protein